MYGVFAKLRLLGVIQYLFLSLFLGTGFEKGGGSVTAAKPREGQTVSIEEFLEPETKEILLGDQEITAFALGLGWEDGYHIHLTEDGELIARIVTEVRNLNVFTDKPVESYTCDAGMDFFFLTKDDEYGLIRFNDTCLDVRTADGRDQLWRVEDMNALWELCLRVYNEGELMD